MYRRRKFSRRKGNKKVVIFAVLLAFIILFAFVNPKIKSVVRVYAQSEVERMCYSAINTAADSAIEQSRVAYADIVKIERSVDNNITAVMTDIAVVNKIKTVANSMLLDAISGIDGREIPIPVGTLTGNSLLIGRGPEISVKAQLTGSAEVEVRSEFESAGINQTRHIIEMDITCRVYSVMLGTRSEQEILLTVPIAETIIVGTVPNAFMSLDNNAVND